MADLTIATLCHALANITHNRCQYVEHSNTCRCIDEMMTAKSTTVVSTTPDIMMSEVFLIFFVLGLWLSAIGFCLNQYKSLRRLETQVHYCVNRKDPLNIGEIKIVTREQDSIIYKKKRYSTLLETHMEDERLKTMQYVREYVPINLGPNSSAISALVVGRDDLTANIPLSTTATMPYLLSGLLTSTIHAPLATHKEVAEEQQPLSAPPISLKSFVLFDTERKKTTGRTSFVHRTESDRRSTGLTVPHASLASSSNQSWNGTPMYETSRSTQHLSVPSVSLRSNRYSDGNISLPVPQNQPKNSDEQLLDPRLIPNTVRRSLLALHRESQENIHMQRSKEKTQSENDVHGSFTPWKIKMKAKLKRTHHHHPQQPQQQYHQQPIRPHSHTLSVLPVRDNSNDQERRASEYATTSNEYRFSTPPLRNSTLSINPSFSRSLKNYPKYSTQSTTESETTQGDLPMITSIYVSVDDEETTRTIRATDSPSPVTSL